MTYAQILDKIAKESESYTEFRKYIDDAGWESWMDDYTEADGMEEPTEAELKNIEKIQKEGWNRSHVIQMGYGFHGGGRKKMNPEDKKIYKTVSISATPDEIEKLKEQATSEGLTLSKYIINKCLK